MAEFLLVAGALVLATVALGLIRLLRGPAAADRMMAAQLVGSGGVGVLLLAAVAMERPAVIDVALALALLSAFAAIAFVLGAGGDSGAADRG